MTDRRTFLAVILILGVTLVACVVGIVVLAVLDKAAPGILENLAVGSLTGLAGLLSRGPTDEPQAVVVHQPANHPVPVEDAAA